MISLCTDCYSLHYNEMHRRSELLDREVHWNTLVQRTNGGSLDHSRCTTCTLYHFIWSCAMHMAIWSCTMYVPLPGYPILCTRVSSKQSHFFSVGTETQSVLVVFRFVSRNQKKCFCLFRCFGPVSKQPRQTELMVWGIKKVYILTNLLLFRLVFCLFLLFWNTQTPCFDIKAQQPKQTPCFG